MPILPKPNLRRLVLAVTILTALIVLATAFYASFRVQRQMLVDNALEGNHAYSAKLAESTAEFLDSAQQQLAHSAETLALRFDEEAVLLEESERLWLQTNSFNSVAISDALGMIRVTAPRQLGLTGRRNQSSGSQLALETRRPLISPPYLSAAGNLVVFISHPIFSPQGHYLGYVGGTIYLKQKNILNSLLGKHFYRDGSYIYVVDQTRRLLYHPEPERIGTMVGENSIIDHVLQGASGSGSVTNSRNIEMLAGYAPVPAAGWGIVAQRPLQATVAPLNGLMLDLLVRAAPIVVLTLLAVWALAYFIARPLSLLARQVREMDSGTAAERIQGIRSWYFEAAELKRAILIGIGLLNQKLGAANKDAQTDPLTSLQNRRGLALALGDAAARQKPFAVLVLDIDHFKHVNDTYGHDVGDLVLKKLSDVMRDNSRPNDLLCRNGGEEFVVLMPDTDEKSAAQIAERLRIAVQNTDMPHGERITISLGVSHWPSGHTEMDEVMKQADQALYRAKGAGRNRVARSSEPLI